MKTLRLGVVFLLMSILLAQSGWMAPENGVRARPADDRLRLYTAAYLGGAATTVRLLPDDYLALAQGSQLVILDALGTFSPQVVGKLDFNGLITDLEVYGQTAYVLVGGRLAVVDVSEPDRPQLRNWLADRIVYDIAIDSTFLYLASIDLLIYSLADPGALQLVGSYDSSSGSSCSKYSPFCFIAGPVLQVVSAYPYLYIRTRYQSCTLWCFPAYFINEVLDISQPANPLKLERPAETESLLVQEALPLGGYWLVQIADNQQPETLADLRVVAEGDLLSLAPTRTLPYDAYEMTLQGDTLYLAGGSDGLLILDATDPLDILDLGVEQTLAAVLSLAVHGSLAYIAGGSEGLGVIEVRAPASPQYAGGYRTVGSVEHVLLAGEILYASSDRLDILDLSDPAAPRLLGSFPQAGAPALAGEVLYLAAGEDGLVALDVSDPTAPQELDRLALPGAAQVVAVVDTYAYVASSEGLQVVAVADPAALALVGSVAGFSAARIAAGTDFLALTSERHLHIFDLTDPVAPQQDLQQELLPGIDYCGIGSESINGLGSDGVRVLVSWDWYCEEIKSNPYSSSVLEVFERDLLGQWSQAGEGSTPSGEVAVSGSQGYLLESSLWSFAADDPLESDVDWMAGFAGDRRSITASETGVMVGAGEAGLYVLQFWQPRELYLPVFAGENVFHYSYGWLREQTR